MLTISAKWLDPMHARLPLIYTEEEEKGHGSNHTAGPGHRDGAGKQTKCFRCGKDHPKHAVCAARNAQCRNCQTGHFAVVCRSARVNEITAVEQEPDYSGRHFLGEIKTKYTYITDSNTPWTVKLTIRDTPVTFKIDTGADSTVMSDETYYKLIHPPQLASDDMDFDSPGGKLDGLGQFTALT